VSAYLPKKWETKYELFYKLFDYWSQKLLKQTFQIVRDNRYHGHLVTNYNPVTGEVKISYNTRLLGHWSIPLVISGVFHEIGHILQEDAPYETFLEQVQLESDAERYAIKMMKAHYPKKYLKAVIQYTQEVMKSPTFRGEYPAHFQAYQQIPEYAI